MATKKSSKKTVVTRSKVQKKSSPKKPVKKKTAKKSPEKKAGKATPRKLTTRTSTKKTGKTTGKTMKKTPAVKVETAIEKTEPRELEVNTKKIGKQELKKYKDFLTVLRDKLFHNIHDLEDDNLKRSQRDITGDLSGYSLHLADMGTENFDRELALNLVSNENELLHKVEEALDRIEDGTFGICICGRKIQEKRLKAVPYAQLCIECQEEEELEMRIRNTNL